MTAGCHSIDGLEPSGGSCFQKQKLEATVITVTNGSGRSFHFVKALCVDTNYLKLTFEPFTGSRMSFKQ